MRSEEEICQENGMRTESITLGVAILVAAAACERAVKGNETPEGEAPPLEKEVPALASGVDVQVLHADEPEPPPLSDEDRLREATTVKSAVRMTDGACPGSAPASIDCETIATACAATAACCCCCCCAAADNGPLLLVC